MVLRYLVARAGSGVSSPVVAAESANGLDQRLLQSNPVLESFGNGDVLWAYLVSRYIM